MQAQSCWVRRHEGARGAGAGGFCPCIPALGASIGLPISFGYFGPKEEEKWLRRGRKEGGGCRQEPQKRTRLGSPSSRLGNKFPDTGNNFSLTLPIP